MKVFGGRLFCWNVLFRKVSPDSSSVEVGVLREVSVGRLFVGVVVFRKLSARKLSLGRCLQDNCLFEWSSSSL